MIKSIFVIKKRYKDSFSFDLALKQFTMYVEFIGYRVNLINIAIFVAIWDIVHILIEYYERYERLMLYEDTPNGCLSDFQQFHCLTVSYESV